MKSLLFDVLVRILRPALWAIAFWLLFRGHNAAGGGFIAGLIAASATILKILSQGSSATKNSNVANKNKALALAGLGLFTSILSGALSFRYHIAFMSGLWFKLGDFYLGTPHVFDIGVFIVVYTVIVICAGYQIDDDSQEHKEELNRGVK